MSPLERYQAQIDSGEMLADPAQRAVIGRLDDLFHRLITREIASRVAVNPISALINRWFGSPVPVEQGLYLWGGVGRGKTMLMDLFCACLPEARRQRMHFHRFMRRVHEGLGRHEGHANPLRKVADELAADADVLCFDEFFVSDIGDAMILGEVLTALFERGVTLVATSNVEPQYLYKNGLQRSRFLPAIAELYAHCDVHEVEHGQDFRLRTLRQARLYHFPLGDAAQSSLQQSFQALANDREKIGSKLRIENRYIETRKVAGDLVWFNFQDLCEGPRSQNDYVELATLFSTVLISNIPVLSTQKEDAARRFISLVDEFYDRNVKLIVSAEASIADLYQGERLAFEFERTRSRLLEMQSEDYLAARHHGD